MTKDWPGCSYFILNKESTVPRDKPIIAIEYRYNHQKVIHFVTSEKIEIKSMYFPTYLIKLTSFLMLPFSLLLVSLSCLSSWICS